MTTKPGFHPEKTRPMLTKETIEQRVQEIADQINKDYNGKEIVCICILKGSVMFFSDLVRKIKQPVLCEFLATSSYGDQKQSSGEVKLTMDTKFPLSGKHILIIEDIVDSGLTLSYIMALLKARQPASIRLCSLLFKPDSLKVKIDVDYTGFSIGNEFVVGYGLDYAGYYRNLPDVSILEE